MPRSTLSVVAIILILLLAGSLRFWGINHSINTDENKVLVPSIKLVKGEQKPLLYPKGSYYPHLYHYVLAGAFLPITWLNSDAAYDSYYNNTFLLTSRIISGVLGCITVLITIALGWRLRNPTTGYIAGLLVAVIPLHVKYSHYAHVDIPLTLGVAVACYAALRMWQTKAARWYIFTGIAVGLSTAILYTGVVAGLLLPLAHLPYVISQQWRWRALLRPAFLIGLAAIPIAFVFASPYSVLRYQEVWATYQTISDRAAAGDLGYTRPNIIWPLWNDSQDWGLPFTSASFIKELYPPIFILALLGLGIAIYRRHWQVVLLFGITAVAFYVVISGQVRLSAVKRFLPLVPVMAVLAAYASHALLALRMPQLLKVAVVILAAAIIFFPTVRFAAGFNAAYAGGSTHKTAVDWAYAHLPAGTVILQHGPLTFFPPDDPRYRVVRLNEVYANYSVANPEVASDRAKPISAWVRDEGIQIVALDFRMVDRYFDSTSEKLFPETVASYQNFYNTIRQEGKLIYKIEPQLGKIAGPHIELYDVRHIK